MTFATTAVPGAQANNFAHTAAFNLEYERSLDLEVKLEPLMPSSALLSSFGTEYLKEFRASVKREFELTRAGSLRNLFQEIDAIRTSRGFA